MREITVSYSELKDARRCPAKHHFGYIKRYSKEHAPDSALGFGIAWHEVLNAYYDALRSSGWYIERGSHPVVKGALAHGSSPGAWHAALIAIQEQPEIIQKELRWMLEGYAATYGKEPGWSVLATELPLYVPLPQLFQDLRVILKVKIDLIVQDAGGLVYVDDHKTCARLPNLKNQVDPQLLLYCYALAMAGGQWRKPFGARYSYSRKPSKTFVDWPLEERFRRRCVNVTEAEMMKVAGDAYQTAYTRYWENEHFREPTAVIQDDCKNRCDFADPCTAWRKGYKIDQFLSSKGFTRWNEEDKAPKEVKE